MLKYRTDRKTVRIKRCGEFFMCFLVIDRLTPLFLDDTIKNILSEKMISTSVVDEKQRGLGYP